MPSFQILGLDHVVLRTRDPVRLERFYIDLLGCSLERRQPDFKLTQLRAGASLIDLIEVGGSDAPAPEARNMDHFCLRVEPFDGAAIQAALAAAGVECAPPRDRFGAEGKGPSVYFHDPDGNRVELKGSSPG